MGLTQFGMTKILVLLRPPALRVHPLQVALCHQEVHLARCYPVVRHRELIVFK
jgi:hypothetical protein